MHARIAGPVLALSATVLFSSAPRAATYDLGTILNESVSLPDTATPGSGGTVDEVFEFTLPVAEFVSASISISGPVSDQLTDGELILETTSGTIIEETAFSPANGGETAVVGTLTSSGIFENAGDYEVVITGVSGGGTLELAIDGNVTAIDGVPETSTWSMLGIGLAGLATAGLARRRRERETPRFAF